MESALLCSCFSFPKFSFSLLNCPPSYIKEVISSFDISMYEAVLDLVGAPLSDWSCWEDSLLISLGGFGIHQASLHAPAVFVSSWIQSTDLIIRFLNCVTLSSPHLSSTLELLSVSANR